MAYAFNDDKSKAEVYSTAEVYTKDEVYNKDEVYTKDEVYSKDDIGGLSNVATITGQIAAAAISSTTVYSATFGHWSGAPLPNAPTKSTAFTESEIKEYVAKHFIGLGRVRTMTAASGGAPLAFPIVGWNFESYRDKTANVNVIVLRIYFTSVTTPVSDNWRVFIDYIYK